MAMFAEAKKSTGATLWSRQTSAGDGVWSRQTSAGDEGTHVGMETLPEFAEELEIATSALAGFGRLVMTKHELQDLLAASVQALPFAVTITAKSARAASPFLCAVSRGARQMYKWPGQSLLGELGHVLDAPESDIDVQAKLKSAYTNGAEAAVVQTQRKASGEVFTAFQYHRGLCLGSDIYSSEDVWYLLTVSFDITGEFEREQNGRGFVDYDFFKEAAISVSRRVRSNITNALSAFSFRHSDAFDGIDDEDWEPLAWDSEAEFVDEDMIFVNVSTPEWVAYPPESTDIRKP